MTRRRLHYGRKGGRKPFSRWAVVPHGWDDNHRPVVEGTWTARVELRHPAVATITSWNAATEQTETTPNPPYFEGWARVQRTAGQGANPQVADDPEPVSTYLVALDADVETEAGDIVTVLLSGDAILDAQPLYVTHVAVGSLRFERDLYCSLNPHQTTTAPAPG